MTLDLTFASLPRVADNTHVLWQLGIENPNLERTVTIEAAKVPAVLD